MTTYEAISPYMVTDISINTMNGLMQRYAEYELADILTPEGENVLGETYYEFYVDEEKLDQLVLDVFYKAK